MATRDPYRSQGVVAAINADYAALDRSHGPEGLTIKNGRRLDGHANGDTDDNSVNRSSLAISKTNDVTISRLQSDEQPLDFDVYFNAVGGGPQVVVNGQWHWERYTRSPACEATGKNGSADCINGEPFIGSGDWDNADKMWTAAGVTQDGNTLILVVGPYAEVNGEGGALRRKGAYQAIKLDGGGSSQMWYNGSSRVRGGREVANALLVFYETATPTPVPPTPTPVPPTPTRTPPPDLECPGQWKGEYFDNMNLSGNPVVIRCDDKIDFDWPVSPMPGSGIPNDGFSVRWTRNVYFDAGSYTFHMSVDDGGRLFVDGNQVIDGWHDGAERRYDQVVELSAGYHTIRMEFYENTGVAAARLWWDEPSPTCPGQWRANYYNNQSLYGFPATLARCDNMIDFDWPGSPAPGTGVPNDGFSVRWERDVYFDAGRYTFRMAIDDGGRLWVGNTLLIDHFGEDGAERWYSAEIDLPAGTHHIRMEHRENTGVAVARLRWDPVQVNCPGQWRGEYYNNMSLREFPATLTRCDGTIDFSWPGSPAPGTGVPNDGFSVRWARDVNFDAGHYRVHMSVDDGGRLFLDGNSLIDAWHDGAEREYTREMDLGGGTHALRMEYYENTGVAVARLWWERINLPPNTPVLLSPPEGALLGSHLLTLQWQDNGDPDNYPRSYRDFWVEAWKADGSWSIASGWLIATSWELSVPTDGAYHWHVSAGDGAASSGWTEARSFVVDASPPDTTIASGSGGCIGTTDVAFTWAGSDNRTPTDQLQYSFWLEGYDPGWTGWGSATSKTYTGLPDGPYTLHVKAKDGVGHEDSSPAGRTFQVDTTPPSGSVLINGGDSTANQIAVRLDIAGNDGPLGCGVTGMRLANDDHNYKDWRSFEEQTDWYLPPVNRATWTVHLQLKDLVGNVSGAFTDDIYLDFYPPRPESESYQLGARVTAGGDGQPTSESYQLDGATLGQALDGGRGRSRWYRLESGFQGAWPAVPQGRPPAEAYDVWDNVMASSGDAPNSEHYRMYGTGGQPVADSVRTSESYRLVSGFWVPAGWDVCGDDYDRDGVIGAGDIQRQIAHWRTSMGNRDPDRNPETPNYEARYDRKLDGAINVADVMRLAARWGWRCVVRSP